MNNILSLGAACVLVVAFAGSASAQMDTGYNPFAAAAAGQQIEENQARAYREGIEMRERQAGSWTGPLSAPPPSRYRQRTPTVTNPYSPYLGLPADMAEGEMQRQIQQLNEKIDRMERQRR